MTETLGEKLKARRLEQKRTLQNLAWYMQTSKGHISDFENGKIKRPSFKFICDISQILDVPLDELRDILYSTN